MRRDRIADVAGELGHHIMGGRMRCPDAAHEDRTPSAFVHPDERGGHIHCYGCGAHWDLVDFLVQFKSLTMRQALEEAGRPIEPGQRPRRAPRRPQPDVKPCTTEPLPLKAVAEHQRRARKLQAVPAALEGRGLTLEDCRELQVAETNGDAYFPIPNAAGDVLRIKVRLATPRNGMRYFYSDPHGRGAGSPAWCSRSVVVATLVLVIEGELNAMIAWRARPDLGVIGPAGVNGCVPLDALTGKDVVVYTDGDNVGNRARQRWAAAAHEAGARSVMTLSPWTDGDACDIAGAHGLDELTRRLS